MAINTDHKYRCVGGPEFVKELDARYWEGAGVTVPCFGGTEKIYWDGEGFHSVRFEHLTYRPAIDDSGERIYKFDGQERLCLKTPACTKTQSLAQKPGRSAYSSH